MGRHRHWRNRPGRTPPRQHQRNGYASTLYYAAAAEIAIYHAPEAHRTPEGDIFAQSVGGESLPCLHGCCNSSPDFDDEE